MRAIAVPLIRWHGFLYSAEKLVPFSDFKLLTIYEISKSACKYYKSNVI